MRSLRWKLFCFVSKMLLAKLIVFIIIIFSQGYGRESSYPWFYKEGSTKVLVHLASFALRGFQACT